MIFFPCGSDEKLENIFAGFELELPPPSSAADDSLAGVILTKYFRF